jgi:hypothetical protein
MKLLVACLLVVCCVGCTSDEEIEKINVDAAQRDLLDVYTKNGTHCVMATYGLSCDFTQRGELSNPRGKITQ